MVAQGSSETKSKGGVFVFLEQTDGQLEDVSLEVLGKAKEISDRLHVPVSGILLGQDLTKVAEECTRRGADTVFLGESPLLKEFTTEPYSKVVTSIIRERDPDILLIGATHNGTSLAGSLAINVGVGLMAHVVDLEIENGTGMLLGSVPGFGGNIVAVCKCKRGRPQMATVRPGVFKPFVPNSEHGNTGRVEPISVDVKPEDVKCTIVEKSVGKSAEISHAEKVVVAGLGCKGGLDLPKKIAQSAGGVLAVSRPVADKGAAPKDLVVGSTGSSLNAKLAIILGVSGAAHFSSGIRDVKTVVAINSDPEAPIFKQADYCVVGDLVQILPMLLSELDSSSQSGGA